MMAHNPILDEIYAARDNLLAEYEGDVHAYVQDARRRALASGRPIATPTQRTKRFTENVKAGTSQTDDRLSAEQ